MEHKTFEQLRPGDKICVLSRKGSIKECTVIYVNVYEQCGDLGITITPGLGRRKVEFLCLLIGFYHQKLFNDMVIATSKELLYISEEEYKKQFKPRLWK